MIAVHELLADFDFQRSKVNFYELKSVIARLIDSIRYVRERKNPLGRRLVNYDLGGRSKSDTSRISIYLNARHQYIHVCTYLYAALCTIAVLAKQNVFVCRLGVFCDLWKNTSLHATLEKNLLSCYVALYLYRKKAETSINS